VPAVFVASACVMMMEMAAGRIISRQLGQSLYTWTSVIGVVLAGLSLGNWIGGRLADRPGGARRISLLMVLASVVCLLIPALVRWPLTWSWLWVKPWPVRIFIQTLLAFFPSAAVFGLLTPLVLRAALPIERPGRVIGLIYAAGAVGSIAGTFLAGFWLIASLGTMGTLALTAFLIALTGAGLGGKIPLPWLWLGFCALILFAACGPGPQATKIGLRAGLRETAGGDVLFFDESQYQAVTVKIVGGDPAVRGMYLDKMLHSEMDVRAPTNLLYRYWWVYEAVMDKYAPPGTSVNAFVIGGGGYTFPQYLALTRPGSLIDVAEIDPVVTEAAVAACGFNRELPIRVHHMDARNYVSDLLRHKAAGEPVPLYQYVLGDTFNDYSVPYHLTTEEFHRQLSDLMTPDGIYILNLIDQFDSGRFLGSIIMTCRRVFADVQVFFCHRNLASRGTYVVVCSKVPRDLANVSERIAARHDFYGHLLTMEEIDGLLARCRPTLLTDDHAPVENLLADVVRRDMPEGMDVYYLRLGLEAAEQGHLDIAIGFFEKSLAINWSSAQVWYNLGVAWMMKSYPARALDAFAMAIRLDPDAVDVRNNAAVVLARLGRTPEAIDQVRAVLERQPENADAHVNLAVLLAGTGQYDEAAAHFEAALQINPKHTMARQNLERLNAIRGADTR